MAQPGQIKSQYRPEKMYQGRRTLLLLVAVSVILVICISYAFTLANPTKGLDKIASVSASGSGTVTVTLPNIQPTQNFQSNTMLTAVRCRMIADVNVSSGLLFSNAQVVVSGWSWSNGGMVFVSDPNVGWLPAAQVGCPQNVMALERPYLATPIPSSTVTPTSPRSSAGAVAPVVRIITATPAPVYPTVVPTLANAAYIEGDCVLFNVRDVKSIFVNGGTPVSGGARVCSVTSFTVNR